MLSNAEVEALKSAFSHNNDLAGWSTRIVFVGLIVEYSLLLWLKWREISRLEQVLTIACGIAVAGGVYGEYFFGSNATEVAILLQNDSDTKVGRANAHAAEANESAAQARLALEQQRVQTSWRTINAAVFRSILREHASGITVDVWYKREDTEAYLFAQSIWSALDGVPGWRAGTLQAIPLKGRDPSSYVAKDVPADVKYGSTEELTLKYWKLPRSPQEKMAMLALGDALSRGQEKNGRGRIRGGVGSADPSLPVLHCIIIVGQESQEYNEGYG
jgi:hypothetical protein